MRDSVCTYRHVSRTFVRTRTSQKLPSAAVCTTYNRSAGSIALQVVLIKNRTLQHPWWRIVVAGLLTRRTRYLKKANTQANTQHRSSSTAAVQQQYVLLQRNRAAVRTKKTCCISAHVHVRDTRNNGGKSPFLKQHTTFRKACTHLNRSITEKVIGEDYHMSWLSYPSSLV